MRSDNSFLNHYDRWMRRQISGEHWIIATQMHNVFICIYFWRVFLTQTNHSKTMNPSSSHRSEMNCNFSLICETSANATEKKLRAIICHSHTFRRNRQLDAFVAWFHYCGELGSGLFPLRFSRDRYITSKMTVYIFRQPDCSRTWVTPSSTLTRPQTAIFELFPHAFSAAQA